MTFRRTALVFVIGLILLLGGVAARLVDLQVLRHADFLALARRQVEADEQVEHRRGTIEDAAGRVLAISKPVESVWAVPRQALSQAKIVERLSVALHLPEDPIRRALERTVEGPDGERAPAKFAWIKRKVTTDEAAAVRTMKIDGVPVKGIFFRQEFQRVYPQGSLASQILGAVGLDDQGLNGVEAMLEAEMGMARPVLSLYADSARLGARTGAVGRLAAALGRPEAEIRALLMPAPADGGGGTTAPSPSPVRIEKALDDAKAAAVRALELPGVSLRREYVSAVSDVREVMRDGRMRLICPTGGGIDPLQAGASVRLTVDLVLQQMLEEELESAVREYRPQSAWAIALDPRTGAVLAMTCRPTYDPNRFGASPLESRRNRCLTDPFEPGSTFKPFVCAIALEHGVVTPRTPIYCENGLFHYGARILHDHNPYGTLTVREVIEKSSNIGIAKIGLLLKARRLYDGLRRYGFGVPTGIDLPGEDGGLLHPFEKWSSFSITSVPMGHEIMVTPLQLASAFCVFANGGKKVRPYVIQRVTDASSGRVLRTAGAPPDERVLLPATVATMLPILEGVVEVGTGKKAALEDYRVAGKTGTTQLVVGGHYSHEAFISSFVGFAPAADARLCVLVSLDRPQGAYYGGTVSAPVVGKFIERALPYLGVPPAGKNGQTSKAGENGKPRVAKKQ